jgi:hypothetical protein
LNPAANPSTGSRKSIPSVRAVLVRDQEQIGRQPGERRIAEVHPAVAGATEVAERVDHDGAAVGGQLEGGPSEALDPHRQDLRVDRVAAERTFRTLWVK